MPEQKCHKRDVRGKKGMSVMLQTLFRTDQNYFSSYPDLKFPISASFFVNGLNSQTKKAQPDKTMAERRRNICAMKRL